MSAWHSRELDSPSVPEDPSDVCDEPFPRPPCVELKGQRSRSEGFRANAKVSASPVAAHADDGNIGWEGMVALNIEYLEQCDDDLQLSTAYRLKAYVSSHKLAEIDQMEAFLADNFIAAGLDRSDAAAAGYIVLAVIEQMAGQMQRRLADASAEEVTSLLVQDLRLSLADLIEL
jgi:hypothetical protein